MDLDKLIASFQATADESIKTAPLVTVAIYIPPRRSQSKAALKGSRQLVAVFLLWLTSRGQLSIDGTKKLEVSCSSSSMTLDSAASAIREQFSDQIVAGDIDAATIDFCRRYLAQAQGSYSDDFHTLFVEGTPFESFLDIDLSDGQLGQIFEQIDRRFSAFQQSDPEWQLPLQPPAFVLSDRHSSYSRLAWDVQAWTKAIRSFDNLESTPAGQYKSSVTAYLAVIDQAVGRLSQPVANELVRTYAFHADSAVQSGVWRLLRTFPPGIALRALIKHITLIDQTTSWAPELVDVFDDDLDLGVIEELADILDTQSQEVRLIYATALRRAQNAGSRHASALLARWYPAEGR